MDGTKVEPHDQETSQPIDDEDNGSGWSAESTSESATNENEYDGLEMKQGQLQSISNEINQLSQQVGIQTQTDESMSNSKDQHDWAAMVRSLQDKIELLESENHLLSKQLESQSSPIMVPPMPSALSHIDQDIVQFLDDHRDDITLDFLKTSYDTLIEMKASDPECNFAQYIQDIKKGSAVEELKSLREGKKRAEIKFNLLKKSYEEELTSFNETRVEHIFKNSGAKEYLDKLKERTKTKDDIIKSLRDELEYKCKEIDDLRNRVSESERKCNNYLRDLKEAQARKEQLESEKRSSQERDRRMNLGHISSASSLAENPPPQFNYPTMNEILMRPTTVNQDTSSPYNDLSFGSSIPPPPPPQPIDVPLHEILHE